MKNLLLNSKTKKYNITIFLILILFSLSPSNAQEIEAVVSIDTEQLTDEQLQNVESLKNNLEDYINSQNFTGEDWEGPTIPVSITIQLIGRGRYSFSANMFIISKRGILGKEDGTSTAMKFIDRKWSFEYNNNAALSYDPNRYDPLTSVLDFYMLVIIGLELDSYGELDGNPAFRKADNLLNVAINAKATGWASTSEREFTRKTLIYELTNARFDDFRKLMFEYYIDGIDMLTTDKDEALENIASTISQMADFKERYVNPSHLLDSFFYTKSKEFAELLKGYKKDPKVFRNLIFLDPQNTELYESAKSGN